MFQGCESYKGVFFVEFFENTCKIYKKRFLTRFVKFGGLDFTSCQGAIRLQLLSYLFILIIIFNFKLINKSIDRLFQKVKKDLLFNNHTFG
jgi:hypothetical protein